MGFRGEGGGGAKGYTHCMQSGIDVNISGERVPHILKRIYDTKIRL